MDVSEARSAAKGKPVMTRVTRLVLILATMGGAVVMATGVALAAISVEGTEGADNYTGTADNDFIDGRGDSDTLQGLEGNDELLGGDGDDYLYGGNDAHDASLNGNDTISGELGNDYVEGSAGADTLNGGAAADTVVEGPDSDQAFDTILGAGGDDEISVAGTPASQDNIDCGTGVDYVQADALDTVSSNCENVDVFDPNVADDSTPVPEGDYKRFCVTKRWGWKQCGNTFTVFHQDTYVKLRDSERNRRIDFKLRVYKDALCDTWDPVSSCYKGSTAYLYPPQFDRLWRNDSRYDTGASIYAASPRPFKYWVKATVWTRSF